MVLGKRMVQTGMSFGAMLGRIALLPVPTGEKNVVSFRGGIGLQRWSKWEVWQEWTANGPISAALVRGFVPSGGDPGEQCYTLTNREMWWENGSHLSGSKKEIPANTR
jgi:hypothetical protein